MAYVDVNAEAVFVPINQTNKPDGLITDGDRWCFVTEEVVKDDLIVDTDSTEWQVVFVEAKFPGTTAIVWRAQVRS